MSTKHGHKYMTMRSWMTSKCEKLLHSTLFTLTMNMSIRSRMSLIMSQVIPDQLVFSVLETEKLNFCSLFGIYIHCYPVLLSTQVSDIGPSWSSCFSENVMASPEHWV